MASHPRLTTHDSAPRVDRPSRGLLGTAVQAVVLLLLLAILAGVVLVLFAFASLINVPGQVAGGVGTSLSGLTSQASRAVSGAQQAIQNATDPNHPPSGLIYDNEFNQLQTWKIDERLPDGAQYLLSVRSIQRRDGSDSSDTALYAVIHAELRQPRETRVFGQLVRSDSDPRDHVVYKGETFRIGRSLYRVNWISLEERALAAATYRHPDAVSSPLKFGYD